MVVATFGAIYRTMAHNDNPWGPASINPSKMLFQPLILLVGLIVLVRTVNCSKGTSIRDVRHVGLRMSPVRQGLCPFDQRIRLVPHFDRLTLALLIFTLVCILILTLTLALW
jgi:hypothetical protein